jgi:hypothetical protein
MTKLSQTRRVVAAAVVLVLVSACAHLSVKQQLTVGLQGVETALGAAQDVERAAYQSHAFPDLTAKVHGDVSASFVKAFSAVITSGQALKVWRAGDPVPTTLVELQKDVDETLALVASVAPKQSAVVVKAQAVADEVLQVLALVKGAK